MMTSLSKLQALKLSKTPSPLWLFLTIYSKAQHECYINYNEGAKVLYSWLTSDGTIPLDYQIDKYPEIANTSFKVPALLQGYESSELSKILASDVVDFSERLVAMARADRAIYITMNKKVVYELY